MRDKVVDVTVIHVPPVLLLVCLGPVVGLSWDCRGSACCCREQELGAAQERERSLVERGDVMAFDRER